MSIKDIINNIIDTFRRLREERLERDHQREVQTDENIRRAGEKFLNGYGENFHCSTDQYVRFRRALSADSIGTVLSINRKRIDMRIRSSRDSNLTYTTSLTACQCEDFRRRRRPCKHMYKLALELDIIDAGWDLSGLSASLKHRLDSLTPNAVRALLRLMDNNSRLGKFEASKRSVPAILVQSGLLVEENAYDAIIEKHYTKEELLAFVSTSPSCSVSSKDKKTQIIRYIIEKEPKLLKALISKHYTLSFSNEAYENFDYIYRYCSNLQED